MSSNTFQQRPAPERAMAGARRRMIRSATLAAVAAAALAACGPDNGGGASGSSVGANGPSAAASAVTANPAPAPIAPACPKLVTPRCPAAPAPTGLSQAPAVQSRRPAAHAAVWSGGAHRTWSRVHVIHRGGGLDRERRDWDLGRPWPGDRPDAGREDYRGLTRGDRMASEQDDLMGGPAMELRRGYRLREESRETERSEFSGSHGDDRVIETDREEGRGHIRPCPLNCRGGWTGDWRGGYRTTGVDAGGYLVWPGKVEY